MPGVQRLKQVEGLRTANLAQNNAVRSMSEGGAQQVRDGYGRDGHFLADWHLRTSRLEADQVRFLDQDLGGLFNQDDAIRFGNPGGQPIQERRLSRSRSAGNEDVPSPVHSPAQLVGEG